MTRKEKKKNDPISSATTIAIGNTGSMTMMLSAHGKGGEKSKEQHQRFHRRWLQFIPKQIIGHGKTKEAKK
jgi:hypothetical protein